MKQETNNKTKPTAPKLFDETPLRVVCMVTAKLKLASSSPVLNSCF